MDKMRLEVILKNQKHTTHVINKELETSNVLVNNGIDYEMSLRTRPGRSVAHIGKNFAIVESLGNISLVKPGKTHTKPDLGFRGMTLATIDMEDPQLILQGKDHPTAVISYTPTYAKNKKDFMAIGYQTPRHIMEVNLEEIKKEFLKEMKGAEIHEITVLDPSVDTNKLRDRDRAEIMKDLAFEHDLSEMEEFEIVEPRKKDIWAELMRSIEP